MPVLGQHGECASGEDCLWAQVEVHVQILTVTQIRSGAEETQQAVDLVMRTCCPPVPTQEHIMDVYHLVPVRVRPESLASAHFKHDSNTVQVHQQFIVIVWVRLY